MHARSGFARGQAALVALPFWILAYPAAAGPKGAWPLPVVDQAAVERARAGAALRLQERECQRVVDDFKDGEHRPLRLSLEKFGVSAAEYVHMIAFVRGSNHPLCLRGTAVLVTSPGFPRVYVCSSFAMTQVRQPELAETLVIHEMLHTLGLGENPPSSLEITKQVAGRCR
jgi:hypothetical protein